MENTHLGALHTREPVLDQRGDRNRFQWGLGTEHLYRDMAADVCQVAMSRSPGCCNSGGISFPSVVF